MTNLNLTRCLRINSLNPFIACLMITACSIDQPKPKILTERKVQISSVSIDSQTNPVQIETAQLPIKPIEKVEKMGDPKKTTQTAKTKTIIQSDTNLTEKSAESSVLPVSKPAVKTGSETVEDIAIAPAAPNYEKWNKVLQTFVSSNGRVDYKSLKADQSDFGAAIQVFKENTPQENWSRNEKLAYWINIYNAYTIQLILDNYPLKKITDLDGGKTWDVKRIELGGKRYSLNQIENDIIRPKFKDARIHFALNCGAKGCPPLFNQTFLPETLDEQLTSRTRSFIRNEKFNQISAEMAVVSRIFDWYGVDFGDVKTYLNKYLKTKVAATSEVSFNDYDWNLNE